MCVCVFVCQSWVEDNTISGVRLGFEFLHQFAETSVKDILIGKKFERIRFSSPVLIYYLIAFSSGSFGFGKMII